MTERVFHRVWPVYLIAMAALVLAATGCSTAPHAEDVPGDGTPAPVATAPGGQTQPAGETSPPDAEAPPPGDTTAIESSLDDLEVLPPRIRWTATPGHSIKRISLVRFIVDGQKWWTDATAPFSYGPAGASLATTWLDPQEPHRFTVAVQGFRGQSVEETVVAAVTATARETADIATSLDGVARLPQRIRWTVTTNVPPEQVEQVHFLIDGKPAWIDHEPPFAYGPEGAYLATTWLDPAGRHRFTVRLIETNGATSTRTVSARVRKPPRGDELSGILGRLPRAAIDHPPPQGELPDLTAWLNVGGGWLWVGRSPEHAFAYESWANAGQLYVRTPIFLRPGEVDEFAGWFLRRGQCPANGPTGVYTYTYLKGEPGAYGALLLIKAKRELCEQRRKVLEGVWQLLD